MVAGVAPTLRPANRQYPQIAADLGYTAPSFNAFDRLTDVDTPMRSRTRTSAARRSQSTGSWARPARLDDPGWRYWDWKPSNDRDFIGLAVTPVSAAPSKQTQWTQEIRYAGAVSSRVNIVGGAFFFHQAINSAPSFKQEQGDAAARFLLAPTPAAATPGLLDGYGFNQYLKFQQPERGVVRTGRMAGDRQAAAASRSPFQLRRQAGRLRSTSVWRAADDGSRADRPATSRFLRRKPIPQTSTTPTFPDR